MIENRPYKYGNSNGDAFFFGNEVEHTPVKGARTLFVIGVQTEEDINSLIFNESSHLDTSRHIEHIYFGANMSFPYIDTNDSKNWCAWEQMIRPFLDQDYLCTLDIPINCVEGLLESGLCEHHNFIPMISAKIPYIQQLGYNATIKIDDIGFNKTNPGVWCHSLHTLMDRSKFTDWKQYTKDEIVK
jgi:hypothetical protein